MEKLIAGSGKLGLRLTSRQVEQFDIYYHELRTWNDRMNLTAILSLDDVQTKHFLDSLTIALAIPKEFPPDFRVIDVGTGAGLPGIPLKILLPEMHLTLLESIMKKTEFLNHLVGRLGLDNVNVVSERAEDMAHMPAYRETYDLIICRAVAQLPTLAELTLPFCKIGGMVVAPKKGDIRGEVDNAAHAIATMGGRLREIRSLSLQELADDRVLVILDKLEPTPTQFPRRAGMPHKRPLL